MATILVIDDDPDVLVLVRSALEDAGHEVLTTDDPSRVGALASGRRPDAVVLDIQMPGLSGYEVLRALREKPQTGGLPILFLSALSGSEERIRGLREGADDFLAKPFAPEELALRVERLVARPWPGAATAASAAADLERSLEGGTLARPLYLGRYQALEVVGKGAMGLVFRGYDPKLKRPVALKALRFERFVTRYDRRSKVSRLLHEAVTVARFNHPNIVTVYDVADAADFAFLAMEYVDGASLSDYRRARGRLEPAQVAAVAAAVAAGLGAAHAHGIVHHDVKSGNVLLGVDGSIKVTDFGVAQAVSSLAGRRGKVFGTPGYLPPETLLGEGYDEAGDFFGLGVILHHALTGDMPFPGGTLHQRMLATIRSHVRPPRERHPEVPAELSDLVVDLLVKDPRKRLSRAAEVLERLEPLERGGPPSWPGLEDMRRAGDGESCELPSEILDPRALAL